MAGEKHVQLLYRVNPGLVFKWHLRRDVLSKLRHLQVEPVLTHRVDVKRSELEQHILISSCTNLDTGPRSVESRLFSEILGGTPACRTGARLPKVWLLTMSLIYLAVNGE